MINLINQKRQNKIYKSKMMLGLKKNIEKGDFILGSNVYVLERKLAKLTKSKYCISCSSGTDALLMSLMSLNVKHNDIIFTTVFSYISTAEVISILGAIPVFIDVDEETYNICPKKLDDAINKIKKKDFSYPFPKQIKKLKKINIKAVISVSLFGNLYDVRNIKKVCRKYRIKLIEDAAQSFGSRDDKYISGNTGDFGCFSFYPTKSLGCYGDGGAILVNKKSYHNRLKSIRVHGQKSSGIFERLGITGRLDTLQATVLLEKLKNFNKEMYKRNSIAKNYDKFFEQFSEIKTQKINKKTISARTVYSIKFNSEYLRNYVVEKLKNKKIGFGIYYKKPFHLQKVFKYLNLQKNDFPIAENLSKNILSIPIDPYLNSNEISKIKTIIKNAIKKFYS